MKARLQIHKLFDKNASKTENILAETMSVFLNATVRSLGSFIAFLASKL